MINWVERLNYALTYIDNNLCDDIDFNEVSRIAACPIDTLQRFFVLNTGMTLTEYIRRRKLHEAFNELQTTDTKVIDIAVKYGYGSSDAFSVAFKRIYGVSPSMARSDKTVTAQPFWRMIFSLSINYIQGEEIMKSEKSEVSSGGNWYTYFYDEAYGWSWSPQYIGKYHGEDGKRLTIRVNPDFRDKWQGCDYRGGKTFNDVNRKSYGIEIYTALHTKIKTYDTVKIAENGNIIIGGDTILNILGDVIQSGSGECMIGRYDQVRDGRGNVISDEIIKAEIETYGNSIGFNYDNEKLEKLDKRLAVKADCPWKSYNSEDNKILHVKDGTKIICSERTHCSNINRILNGETNSGFIRLDRAGEIKLSNGMIINAPKNTIVNVEYESGECTIVIGDDSATIVTPDNIGVTVPQGTLVDNKGNVIK